MTENRGMIVSLAGDCLIQHRVSRYKEPRFLALAEHLRGADLAIANLECNITQGEDPPSMWGGGGHGATFMATPPFCLEELQWFGIEAVWCANNHSADFGEGGMVTTIGYLEEAGMSHAGTGHNLTEASMPAYVDTGAGRVAVISASDWGPRGKADLPFPIPLGALAADQGPMFMDRPGANLVRFDAEIHVDAATLDTLRRVSAAMGWDEAKHVRATGGGRSDALMGYTMLNREVDTETEFYFMGTKFILDDTFTFETVPYEVDLERNYAMIREARRQADVVIVGFHQQGAGRRLDEPSDHVLRFAHGAIDAGADVFCAHGRGRLNGMEVYKEKPIIYGLPGFIMQVNQVRHVPPEMLERWGFARTETAAAFLEARDRAEAGGRSQIGVGTSNPGGLAIADVVFDTQGRPEEVRFHPLEVTGGTRPQQGRPMMAEPGGEISTAVLEGLAARSKPFGTNVQVRDGVGTVRLR